MVEKPCGDGVVHRLINQSSVTLQLIGNLLTAYLFSRVMASQFGTTSVKDAFDIANSVPMLVLSIGGFGWLHMVVTSHFSRLRSTNGAADIAGICWIGCGRGRCTFPLEKNTVNMEHSPLENNPQIHEVKWTKENTSRMWRALFSDSATSRGFYPTDSYRVALSELGGRLPKSGDCLDICCGTGTSLDVLASNGYKCSGTDIDGQEFPAIEKRFGVVEGTICKFDFSGYRPPR